ncbi:reverse transcriptase domain-containing protein [Tanacetum coccineum]
MPSNVKTYDGSEDPDDHLKIFQAAVKVERRAMPTWCHMFNSTLTGSARVWFDDLPPEFVDSYDDLKEAFLVNFLQQKKCITDPVEIHHIKQKEGESTKDFVQRKLDENKISIKGETSGTSKGQNNDVTVGHNTDECMHLKRQIEELIKAGKLSQVIKELKQGSRKDQSKAAKKGEASGRDKALAFLMVQPWQRVARQRFTQSFSPDPEISSPPLGDEDGTEGPMIIEAEIGGHFIHRIYVDGGSALEILYEHCFNRLRPEIGDTEHSTSTWMNFVVVRSPSPYNGIIGRPGVRKIQAVPLTAHGMLKFRVPGGILTLRSNKIILLECTMVSGPEAQPFASTRAAEERIKVAIHPKYPEQTIAIGSTLTEEGKRSCAEKEKEPSTGKKQVNTRRSIKTCGSWHHKGSSLPQLVVKPECQSNLPTFGRQGIPEANLQELEVEAAFKEIKKLIAELPTLTVPMENEELIVYLAAAREAVSAVLMTEREAKPSVSIKRQILADFIVERPKDDSLVAPMEVEEELPDPWTLFTDGSSCVDSSGAGLILTNPEGT